MGNKNLVSVFDSERTAFEGLTALKDLHRDGDITLYASTVIAKDTSGSEASVCQAADRGPIGTLVGIVTGGLVGLLGGPAGVAVGAYVGGSSSRSSRSRPRERRSCPERGGSGAQATGCVEPPVTPPFNHGPKRSRPQRCRREGSRRMAYHQPSAIGRIV